GRAGSGEGRPLARPRPGGRSAAAAGGGHPRRGGGAGSRRRGAAGPAPPWGAHGGASGADQLVEETAAPALPFAPILLLGQGEQVGHSGSLRAPERRRPPLDLLLVSDVSVDGRLGQGAGGGEGGGA